MNAMLSSRRSFMKLAGAASVGLGAAACTTDQPTPTSAPAAAPAPTTATLTPSQANDEMDAAHEAAVKKFVANVGKDPGFWKTTLEPKMDGDVKVFEVTAADTEWEVSAGMKIPVMSYNGIVPGPEIRVTEGDRVRVVLTNKMVQSTAIHFHGCIVPNEVDGVPFITQPVCKPGQSFTYEFVARNPGSHMYHSHHNAAEQVTKGLLAPFIIEPKDRSQDPAYDSDYTIIINDTGLGLTFNGKSFPDTQPIVAKVGERIRVRYMNEGLMIHPMHLHGIEQVVFAKDGWNYKEPWTCDTLNVAPGERYDVLITAHSPGVWAFHCHVLTHAESTHGMFGMVTALIVK
jgi:FtsP/CotA-like multicopper oxidase with cupredoxin domain